MTIDRIAHLLEKSNTADRNFPPTDLYNEGWMLRLVLDWFSGNRNLKHELNFPVDARWYSEALLPSAFKASYRKDKLAESWTHADGVIGHFLIGEHAVGDLSLTKGASHLVVIEAKMFSKLSSGVKNAKYYNQAARNVACIAEVLERAKIIADQFDFIGFFVVAPKSQIDEGVFSEYMEKESIYNVVERRVSEYGEQNQKKISWFKNWFEPTLQQMRIRTISWKKIIDLIAEKDPISGAKIKDFYQKCLNYNQYAAQKMRF